MNRPFQQVGAVAFGELGRETSQYFCRRFKITSSRSKTSIDGDDENGTCNDSMKFCHDIFESEIASDWVWESVKGRSAVRAIRVASIKPSSDREAFGWNISKDWIKSKDYRSSSSSIYLPRFPSLSTGYSSFMTTSLASCNITCLAKHGGVSERVSEWYRSTGTYLVGSKYLLTYYTVVVVAVVVPSTCTVVGNGVTSVPT